MIKKLFGSGKSKREIAKRLSISRETVRKYSNLDIKSCFKTKKRKCLCNQIKPYIKTIENMLKISKQQDCEIPISAIYDEIKALGYNGTLRWLQKFIKTRKLKVKNQAKQITRFETLPGWQMQVDWIEFKKQNLSAFVATMGYSRVSYVEYVKDESIQTLIRCHINAFNYFGGVCHECLYDNMKTVIIARNLYGYAKHKFNPMFEDFAKHYGFKIKVCKPYSAKTKGKVERFNRYLRYTFHNTTIVKFANKNYPITLDIMNIEVLKWLDEKANKRIHATTKQVPLELLKEEQKNLLPIQKPYQGIHPNLIVNDLNSTISTKDFSGLEFLNHRYQIPQRDMSCYDEFIPKVNVCN